MGWAQGLVLLGCVALGWVASWHVLGWAGLDDTVLLFLVSVFIELHT